MKTKTTAYVFVLITACVLVVFVNSKFV